MRARVLATAADCTAGEALTRAVRFLVQGEIEWNWVFTAPKVHLSDSTSANYKLTC